MSINIMDLVKGAVSDQVMGQLSGLLGQNDRQKTSSAFESATASVLGGLLKKSDSPQGGQQIFDTAKQADDSILDRLTDLMGGGERTRQIEQQGSGLLDMVFGNQQNGIISTLSRVLGLDKTMIGKLLTMAAPILMGVISRQVKSKSMDIAGFGSMLTDQKQHLGNYLPEGMGTELGLSNLDTGSTPVTQASRPAAATGHSGGGFGSIVKILIPLLLLGALAYFVLGMRERDNGAQEAMDEEIPELNIEGDFDLDGGGATTGITEVQEVDFSSVAGEAGEKLNSLQEQFTVIEDGFTGLNSEDDANALKGKIEGVTGSVGDLGLSKMDGVAKSFASTMVEQFAETIQGLVKNVQNPTLKGILQPAVDALLSKLNSIGL